MAATYYLNYDRPAYGRSRFVGWTLVDASRSSDVTPNCIVQHVLDAQTRRSLCWRPQPVHMSRDVVCTLLVPLERR